MKDAEKVFLTGATGFIGSHVLEGLCAAGFPVVALARPNSNLAHVRSLPAEGRFGDIRDLHSLREAMRGATQVIHTAALAGDWGPWEAFHQTNVVGTLNVLEASRLEGVSHVTITGSISSYGEEDCPQAKDESSPFRSHYPYFLHRLFPSGFNRYRDSKALATQQGIAFAREHSMNLTVLEPVWVYGEREFGTGFYEYVKAVQHGQKFMPGSMRNLFHVIYAGDLAQAYVLAAQKKLPGIERIIVGNPEPQPMHRVFGLFCREAGLPPPRPLPKCICYPLGFILECAYSLVRAHRPPLLTRGRVNMFYDSIHYATQKARRSLGFECRYTLEEGIRRAVGWYKANQYL
jgi:nucleoside-diphosphate-sugar epimerase